MKRALILLGLVLACGSLVAEAGGIRRLRRTCVPIAPPRAQISRESSTVHVATQQREAALQKAVELYRAYPELDHWRQRVTVDRRVSREAGGLGVARLTAFLHANPHDLATQTAVAVCLGDGPDSDAGTLVVGLLWELLESDYERVRYRASESLVQRLQERTLDSAACASLLPALDRALQAETSRLNIESLRFAQLQLSQAMDAQTTN